MEVKLNAKRDATNSLTNAYASDMLQNYQSAGEKITNN